MKKSFPITILSIASMLALATVILYAVTGISRASIALTVVTAIVCFVSIVIFTCLTLFFTGKKKKAMALVEQSLENASKGRYQPSALGEEAEDNLKSIAEKLKQANRENRQTSYVLDGISQCIIAVDDAGVIRIMNEKAINLLGCQRSNIGRDLFLAVGRGELYDNLNKCFKRGSGKFEIKRGDNYYSVDVIRSNDSEYDEIANVIIITDISAQRLASRQRSDFFSNAGHELKTPLTSVQGNTELLLSVVEEGSVQKKYAERIQKEVTRLHTLILDMLKLSSIENLRSEAKTDAYVPLSLRETAMEVVSSLAPEIDKKELAVSVNGDGVVTADPRNIYEIISNLCSNAVHYNVNGGKVDIEITTSKEGVTLLVADTGIGVAEKHIPRLCERFYRVDKSRSKLTGGTGLGLAIVKHVCALYSATLDISSKEGEGTKVTVFFPSESK